MRAARRRLDQDHQRQQAHDLGLVRHELGQQPAQADGLGAEVAPVQPVARAGRGALVEDEVHDGQDGADPVREIGLVGQAVGDPGVADLPLGPDQTLGHGGLRHQEGPPDLRGGEPAQESQGQCHLGGRGQGGMAAREDQSQSFVSHGPLLRRFRCFVAGLEESGLGLAVLA